jgi:hypothetical protein
MRRSAVGAVLVGATLQVLAAQDPTQEGHLYRGPLFVTRPARFVAAPNGGLLEFSDSRLQWSLRSARLETKARSRSIRSIPISGISLRLAFGPTTTGMVTFRLRAAPDDSLPNGPDQLTRDQSPRPLIFAIAPEDRPPGFLALTPAMHIVFTVEHIDNNQNQSMFDNPDATELLWDALGRPY